MERSNLSPVHEILPQNGWYLNKKSRINWSFDVFLMPRMRTIFDKSSLYTKNCIKNKNSSLNFVLLLMYEQLQWKRSVLQSHAKIKSPVYFGDTLVYNYLDLEIPYCSDFRPTLYFFNLGKRWSEKYLYLPLTLPLFRVNSTAI